MVAPPSQKNIQAAYEAVEPKFVCVDSGIAKIRDDGSDDKSRLPEPDSEIIMNGDKIINFLQEADAVTVKHWLVKTGNYLIHEGNWHSLSRERKNTLKCFPKGYKLYTRITGTKANPRRDSYLYGSTTDRCSLFRSPEEFALHVKWMAFGLGRPTDNLGRPLCACCYCSGTPQGEISAMLREKVCHISTTRFSDKPLQRGQRQRRRTTTSNPPIMFEDYPRINRCKDSLI